MLEERLRQGSGGVKSLQEPLWAEKPPEFQPGPVQSKAANFCSDCGMRFVPSAKFCHEPALHCDTVTLIPSAGLMPA